MFPEELAALLKLQRTAIRQSLPRVHLPNRAPENLRHQAEGATTEDEVEMKTGTGTQRASGLDQGATCAEVHHVNEASWPYGRLRDVFGRPAVSRIAAPILYELTHDREPGSYFRTRVRPVPPSTRTAYCARLPCTYSVPDVAVPSGDIVRIFELP